jgi:hypothetical protein
MAPMASCLQNQMAGFVGLYAAEEVAAVLNPVPAGRLRLRCAAAWARQLQRPLLQVQVD